MNRMSKLVVVSLLCMQFAQAEASTPACAPNPCCKPCCPPVCYERGYPDKQCCIPTGYNEPADFAPGPCQWDVWVDASFTYWTAYQEGMDIANANTLILPTNSVTVFQDTSWEPGFKVGFGFDVGHDNWGAFAEYTWFRSRNSVSSGVVPDTTGVVPFWQFNDWDANQGDASEFTSRWRLSIDLLDVGLIRPYYQGSHVVVAPFIGLRAAWIRQNLRISAIPTQVNQGPTTLFAVIHDKSNSWALGPRAGMSGKWHLGFGFRLESDIAGSISFTQYPTVSMVVDPFLIGSPVNSGSISNYNTIRFNNDMNLGLGWGDYFNCRKTHLDFLVTYDFQIFWNQNIMRALADELSEGLAANPDSLFLQGLTVKAQFDF